ncbi:MAG: Gldg family protein [Chloroflexota bacterium]
MRRCFAVVVLYMLFVGIMPSAAQDIKKPTQKVVGFVDDNVLHTSAFTDIGGDGLNRLAEIFQQLGATPRSIKLDEAIASDIDVVVLVRPLVALSPANIAKLWDYLSGGGHLLLAFDPNSINKVNSDRSTSGLSKLLWADYGLGLDDDALIEPWFSPTPFKSVVNTLSATLPENIVVNPVVEPLLHYDVPVYIWSGRSVQVDALSPNSRAYPLLFTETAFGETNKNIFRADAPDPIQMNIGQDKQGRLMLGGISENKKNGSRVALLGDGEILQNIFGLTRLSSTDARPRYPGNYIFAQRLASWLLDLPEADWPSVPIGFTYISLDGKADDWDTALTPLVAKDASQSPIQQVRAFYNDQYLYVLIEPSSGAKPSSITLTMQDVGGNRSFEISGTEIQSVDDKGNKTLLPDAEMKVDQMIEVRLPRRALNGADPITSICLDQNCLKQVSRPPLLTDIDLVPVRPAIGPDTFLLNDGNLRSAPDTKSVMLTTLPGRTLLKLIGRNKAGDWAKAYDGRWEGWIAVSLLAFNADIAALPVLP